MRAGDGESTSIGRAKGREHGGYCFFGGEGKGAEDVGELGLGQGIEVGDLGIEFGAEAGAAGGRAFAVRAVRGARVENFLQQVVETNLGG